MPHPPRGKNSRSWKVQFRVNDTGEGSEILAILQTEKAKDPTLTDGDIFQSALLATKGKGTRKVSNIDRLSNQIQRIEDFLRGDLMQVIQAAVQNIDLSTSGLSPEDEALVRSGITQAMYNNILDGVDAYVVDDDFDD